MNKKPFVRAALLLILILFSRYILIYGLDRSNVLATNYIKVINNEISIDDSFEGMYVIEGLKHNKGILDIDVKADDNDYTLFIRSLISYHEIYLDNKLYSQNINKAKKQFNPNFAYETIEINSTHNIKIYGDKLEKLELFIAKRSVMNNAIENRAILYTIKLMCLIFLVLLFIIMFLNNLKEKYFLVLIFIGINSIIKVSTIGELAVLSNLFNVNISNYNIYQNITTVINTILPILTMLEVFEIKIAKKTYKYIFAIISFVIIILYIDFTKYYGKVFIVSAIVTICIVLYGAVLKKRYYKVILLNSILYFSFAVYKINVHYGNFKTGILNYYTNSASIGTIIYLVIFTMVFLKRYKGRIDVSIKIKKELERINLLRGISHDLKLPLSVIKINSQMIESQKLTSKQIKEYAGDITEEVKILEKMTNNINAYLKLGYIEEKSQQVSVKSVFKKIEVDFNLINHDDKYDFNVLYDSLDYHINMDELELYRLLYNLLDNSFKYSNYNDRISINYKVEDKLIITIEDTGIGMSSDQVDKIFSPFYRLDKSRSKEGLGLGLSVVKGIVDNYGGQIYIESKVRNGTKVIITL